MDPIAILRRGRDAARLARARWTVGRRLQRADGDAARLLRAVDRAVRNAAAPDERAWMERIEQLRARLLADHTELALVDYGAGSPETAPSAAAMDEGRPVTRTVAQTCSGSKSPLWARLLFHLVREIRPSGCVELGTNLGISAAYQGAALALNGRGRLVTLEGAAPVAERAARNLRELGLGGTVRVETGRFQDTLEGVLRELGTVDYAFIDGHHEEQATLRYFDQIHPHLAETAVVVFDDVAWSAGMRRAWRVLQADARVRTALDLGAVGVCVTGPAGAPGERLRLPLG